MHFIGNRMPAKMNHFTYKFITDFIRKAQNQIEQSTGSIDKNESVLQQDRFWLKTVTWTLVGTTVFGVGWLALAKTEEVVVAKGQLKPSGGVKEIRIPAGTMVKEILIEDGEQVTKNQILIRLDQESSSEQLKSLEQSSKDKIIQLTQKNQQLKLKKIERSRTAELNIEQMNTTTNTLELEKKILTRYEILLRQGAVQEIEYLRQNNKVIELQGELIKRKLDGERQISQIDQRIEQINSELAGLRSEKAQIAAKLTEVKVNNKNQLLRSPVEGIAFDVKLTNPGYVSADQSTQAALKIVPFKALDAEVEIPSSKIGFVHGGQLAEISIDSFPATDFGVIPGKLISIGSDALEPDARKGQQEYLYPATIKLEEQKLTLQNGESLPLQVGMSLTANIKLRSVSYLQLLLNTFRSKTDSLREI